LGLYFSYEQFMLNLNTRGNEESVKPVEQAEDGKGNSMTTLCQWMPNPQANKSDADAPLLRLG